MSGEHNLNVLYEIRYQARWTIWYSIRQEECVLFKIYNGEVETFCSVSPFITKTFIERIPWDDFILLGEFE